MVKNEYYIEDGIAYIKLPKKYEIYIKIDEEDLPKLDNYSAVFRHGDVGAVACRTLDGKRSVSLGKVILGLEDTDTYKVKIVRKNSRGLDFTKSNLEVIDKR